jgi:fumarylacetoacetate (FAA) hydrolase
MKLVSIQRNGQDELAIYFNTLVYPASALGDKLPNTMNELLNGGEKAMASALEVDQQIKDGQYDAYAQHCEEVQQLSPVPYPASCRDAYAFRQHVATARANRGVDMIPEFDQFPVFYFTNHRSTYGPGTIYMMPDHFYRLDFELEIAAVVGKQGRNLSAEEADDYIAGYMIMNDLSARQLQMEEMKLNLGPAKGKDMANTFGPYLVTPDELKDVETSPKPGHTGKAYDLTMRAYHNGYQVSEGNFSDMDWTFAEILERVSYGADIYPGDVIGSGTVGTGCYLELNGTARKQNPDATPTWLQEGDEMTLQVDQLGRLHNRFKKEDTDYSLLALKKNTAATE